ncbi:unnamed protein product [Chrysoparadoxa australica]
MMVLCFMVACICALDRVAMSVAILPMTAQFNYSDVTKGLISSVFSWGYLVGLVPAGVLGSFSSPKVVMGSGVVLWSLAQMLSPMAAANSLNALLVCRFFMGMSEAVTVPTIQGIVSQWVPREQRSRWLSLIISGLQLGTVLAYLVSPAVIRQLGWEGLFLLYGGLGLAWMGLWIPLAKGEPPVDVQMQVLSSDGLVAEAAQLQARSLNLGETSQDDEATQGSESKPEVGMDMFQGLRDIPWKQIVTDRPIQATTAAHMAHNWGLYVMIAWLPSYFNQEFHLSLAQSSQSSVLPWVVGAACGISSGWLADGLVNQEILDTTSVRRLFQLAASVGPAACFVALALGIDDPHQAATLFTVAVGLGSLSASGFGSSIQDLRTKYTSVIYSLTSAAACLAGSIGTYLTGVALESTHSWTLPFLCTAGAYGIGGVIYASFYEAKPFLHEELASKEQ